jgi:hypothetical protein
LTSHLPPQAIKSLVATSFAQKVGDGRGGTKGYLLGCATKGVLIENWIGSLEHYRYW